MSLRCNKYRIIIFYYHLHDSCGIDPLKLDYQNKLNPVRFNPNLKGYYMRF